MTSIRSTSRRRFSGAGRPWVPYAFIAPFVIVFLVFLVTPIIVGVVNSLYSRQSSGLGFGGSSIDFVGFDNFIRAFADTDFLLGFPKVLLYGAIQVPVMMIIAAVLALLFDSALVKAKRFFQFAVFLPYAVPSVIAALLWGFLYQPSVSPILQFFSSFGVDLNLLGPGAIWWSIGNINLWSLIGINMIILFSALQSVPREMYEAARIDGAGEVRTALQIKLPMITPALLLTTLSSVIGTLQLFNEPQVLQSITSNIPSDFTPNMAIYAASTLGKDANLSSAMAVILGLATLIVSLLLLAANKRNAKGATDGI
ncbi:ABC transporter permease [Microbacterium sp. CH12i]|uniref:carbohydrate ABC transporter permease n=1 Tax=Microbacterium sp. CH12i TaxID=1479651 RepID=UPI000461DE3B|nr:sugar ABC transporter permease [Microbacterium sp. CH12i]KDA06438.1 ABC transporter permease [Microbacterium sp. CH12i]